jgi:hypothetical protein
MALLVMSEMKAKASFYGLPGFSATDGEFGCFQQPDPDVTSSGSSLGLPDRDGLSCRSWEPEPFGSTTETTVFADVSKSWKCTSLAIRVSADFRVALIDSLHYSPHSRRSSDPMIDPPRTNRSP